MSEQIKRIARIVVFLMAIGGAVVVVFAFLGIGDFGGEMSLSLCDLGSPEQVYVDSYLEMHADQLEQPAGTDDTPLTFVIDLGETAGQIAERLEAMGLITNAELFRRYLQAEGMDAGLEVGSYTLRQTMTIPEIAEALQSGQVPEQVVTIPEGLRLEQVAIQVAAQTDIAEAEFLNLATTGWREAGYDSYEFLASVPPTATLEGFLFPETYRLPEEATAEDVLERMLSTFDQRVTSEMRLSAANRGLSVYQMVTLASIVEREAVIDDERPIIAGVYFNRLDSGWLLNADPTVQYGLGYDEASGQWWRRLYFDQLGVTSLSEVDHAYNTYRYVGLPPGPICSPGLASIQAVAFPVGTDYYYFMADCNADDGSHLFAATEEEHNANYAACGGGE